MRDAFQLEVSGTDKPAQNAVSTMFADRHTKSILSDETIEQHILNA